MPITVNDDPMTINDATLGLQSIRIKLLTQTIDDFDTQTTLTMFLEALAALEVAQRKLELAELFRARETAGNF